MKTLWQRIVGTPQEKLRRLKQNLAEKERELAIIHQDNREALHDDVTITEDINRQHVLEKSVARLKTQIIALQRQVNLQNKNL